MKRRSLREAIFVLMFMNQFTAEEEMPEQVENYVSSLKEGRDDGVVEELAGPRDEAYIREKYGKIKEKQDVIDGILSEASEGWKISRMSKVDLNILRLAVYEMKYDDTVPVGVAINEAVELAKRFGGEDSQAFVNGVLGRIAREP